MTGAGEQHKKSSALFQGRSDESSARPFCRAGLVSGIHEGSSVDWI